MNKTQTGAGRSKAWRKYVKLGALAVILLAVCDTFLFPWFGFRIIPVGKSAGEAETSSRALAESDESPDPNVARSEIQSNQTGDDLSATQSANNDARSKEP